MEFEITKAIPGSLGRAGVIKTAHGEIKTPAFMAVGTHGYVRFLPPSDLHSLGAQAMLSNGFHLRRQSSEIAKAGGLAKWIPGPCQVEEDSSLAWQGPTLTDRLRWLPGYVTRLWPRQSCSHGKRTWHH